MPETKRKQKVIGHFRVFLCLCFKTSLSAKPFIWKWVLHAVSFSCKSISHLDSLWNRGTRELGNGLFEQTLVTNFLPRGFHLKKGIAQWERGCQKAQFQTCFLAGQMFPLNAQILQTNILKCQCERTIRKASKMILLKKKWTFSRAGIWRASDSYWPLSSHETTTME